MQCLREIGRAVYERFREHADDSETDGTPVLVGEQFQLPGDSKLDVEIIHIEKVMGAGPPGSRGKEY